jgi:acetaldehyde dehydrogenase (acetylating)
MQNTPNKLGIAILGSGNIGTDLLIKVRRSHLLECRLFAGRRMDSPGIVKAQSLGVATSIKGIDAILDDVDGIDLVFDATSARDHVRHWPLLANAGKMAIDLTPSNVGEIVVPAVNLDCIGTYRNINMISCGGQASLPLIHAFRQMQLDIEYVEVVSSIASKSAGPATRLNIDEYIENTEAAICHFSGCHHAKAILILNPATPCINMQTTVSIKTQQPDMEKTRKAISEVEGRIRLYVPGYQVAVPPVYENNRIVVSVRVTGLGDYLPTYAGNLDIINCAAVACAEQYARQVRARVFATDVKCTADRDR